MVFICTSDLPRALTASTAAENACATPARVGNSGNALPSAMNSVPYSGPDAPPTFITSVIPTAFSASCIGSAAVLSSSASTASNPRFMFRP